MARSPDGSWIHLRQTCGVVVLENRRTGENIVLDGPHDIEVAANGFALLLRRDGSAPVWASSKLNCNIFEGARKNFDSPQEYIVNAASKTSMWFADAYAISTTHVFGFQMLGHVLSAEIYTSQMPRRGANIRFALPRICDYVVGCAYDGRWITKRIAVWQQYCKSIGCHTSDIRPSRRSLKLGNNEDAYKESEVDEFHAVTFAGIIAFCLYYAKSRKASKEIAACFDSRARELLKAILQKYVPARSADLQIQSVETDVDCTVTFADGCVTCHGTFQRHASFLKASSPVPLEEFLIQLCSLIGRKSDNRQRAAKSVFSAVLESICVGQLLHSDTVDISAVAEDNLAGLQPLVRSGSQRVRQVSGMQKVEISRQISMEPCLRTPQQYFAALAINKRRGRLLVSSSATGKRLLRGRTVQTKTGQHMSKHNSLQYMAVSRRT